MATKRQAQRALDVHEEELAQYKNVVGLGVVQLLDDESKKGTRGTNAVAVYVCRKLPVKELAAGDLIPKYLELKGRGKPIRVPLTVIEQGKVELEFGAVESLDDNEREIPETESNDSANQEVIGKEPL